MKKPIIKEVIVVEGKHDAEKLAKCVEADVIVSNGTHVSKEFLALCKDLNERRGIIVFTDPDGPGEQIRRKIIEEVGTTKHASLHILQTKKKQKVGIEHADCEDILEALKHSATYDIVRTSIEWSDFIALGLSGKSDSQERRDILSEAFHYPKSNAKTSFKYLNMIGISYEECLEILKESSL